MGLTPRFTPAEVRKALEKKLVLIEKSVVRRLQYLGEMCVNEARQSGSYRDFSGNLRNSVGYVVIANGKIVFSSLSKKGAQNVTPTLVAEATARHSSSYALVIVAGMNYASYVEAKGRVVLASAEKFAEKEMPKLLRELSMKIEGM